jgi:hypothetical protein
MEKSASAEGRRGFGGSHQPGRATKPAAAPRNPCRLHQPRHKAAFEKGDFISIREFGCRTKDIARIYDVLWWMKDEAQQSRKNSHGQIARVQSGEGSPSGRKAFGQWIEPPPPKRPIPGRGAIPVGEDTLAFRRYLISAPPRKKTNSQVFRNWMSSLSDSNFTKKPGNSNVANHGTESGIFGGCLVHDAIGQISVKS